MARTRPLGLMGPSEGLRFFSEHARGHTQDRAPHTTAARKIFAESGRANHRPGSAFGAPGPSYRPLEVPGYREFRPACAFQRQLEQCETAWNSMNECILEPSLRLPQDCAQSASLGRRPWPTTVGLKPEPRKNKQKRGHCPTQRNLSCWHFLPASPPTTHTFPLAGVIPRLPYPVYEAKGVSDPPGNDTTSPSQRPRRRDMGEDRTSVSPSVKWTGRAPNPKLPASAGGLPHAGP